MNTVYCPIKNDQINGDDCFSICLVADQEAKSSILYFGAPDDSILPLSIEWTEEQRKTCLNCKWHNDIGEIEE